MRNVALVCATAVIVVGAVVGTALVVHDASSAGTSAASAGSRTPTSSTASVPAASPPDRFTLASAGLQRVVTQHAPSAARPVVSLTSCPFAPGVDLASTGLKAAGLSADGSHRGTVDVTYWTDSGDRGVAVTCRFTGPRAFAAAVHTRTNEVGRAPYPGFDGPTRFGGGRIYRSTSDDRCAAYWAPPASDFVISVQFITQGPAEVAACGAALRAVQPTILAGLLRLQHAS